MLTLLRPKPFRGDQVAAGTVMLGVLVLLLNVRFSDRWSDEANLAYTAAAAVLVLTMAFAAPRELEGPPVWHSTLYVTGFLLGFGALANLATVLGSDSLTASTATWIGALLTLLGVYMAQGRGSASGTLLAAVTGVITTLTFVRWAFSPDGIGTFRYVLLVDVVLLVLLAFWQRVRGPAHGVQLLNAAGLALLGIAVTFALAALSGLSFFFAGEGGQSGGGRGFDVAWTWVAAVLAGGLGLLAAGAADHERGNVLVGITLLFAFVALAGDGNLKGWPIPLAAAAIALLVIGLRPSTPVPAAPPRGAGEGGPASSAPPPD